MDYDCYALYRQEAFTKSCAHYKGTNVTDSPQSQPNPEGSLAIYPPVVTTLFEGAGP